MKNFILSLLGIDPREITMIREANAGLQSQLDTKNRTIDQLRTNLTEQKENNRKLYAYNHELENVSTKLGSEIELVEKNHKHLEQEYDELKHKYDELNQTLDEIHKKWRSEILEPSEAEYEAAIAKYEKGLELRRQELLTLKQKLAQTQGRLGAYVKKYGELPHYREDKRKRRTNTHHPTPNTPNETPQNPTAN